MRECVEPVWVHAGPAQSVATERETERHARQYVHGPGPADNGTHSHTSACTQSETRKDINNQNSEQKMNRGRQGHARTAREAQRGGMRDFTTAERRRGE